jgi:formylglycine-generating enzyme required for sulfatase activity
MKQNLILALILGAHAGALMAADAVIEPPMALITAGSFSMGDAAAKAVPNYPVPQPVHQVRIAAFQMSKYEVTVKQFRQFVEATGYKAKTACWKHSSNDWGMEISPGSWDANAYPQSEYHPAMCVSWNDAKAYTAWLATQTGKPYRLPSEAEWEYAARAGATMDYHFGSDLSSSCRFANTLDKTGSAAIRKMIGKTDIRDTPCDDGEAFTSLPGMFEANAFGLFDMVGNLNEIVEDCQHLTYDGAPANGAAWTTDCVEDFKMRRGGGYSNRNNSAWRGHTGTDNGSSFDGFRVALGMGAPTSAPASALRFEAELEQARAAERARRKSAP